MVEEEGLHGDSAGKEGANETVDFLASVRASEETGRLFWESSSFCCFEGGG